MTTIARLPSLTVRRPGRPARRRLWLVPGLAIGISAGALADRHGVGLMVLLAFGIVPHLPVLLGIGQPHPRGHLAPRAVGIFNVLHEPVVPLALLAAGVLGLLSSFWLVASLAWLGHIVVDWGFGSRLHHPDGSPAGLSILDPRTDGGVR